MSCSPPLPQSGASLGALGGNSTRLGYLPSELPGRSWVKPPGGTGRHPRFTFLRTHQVLCSDRKELPGRRAVTRRAHLPRRRTQHGGQEPSPATKQLDHPKPAPHAGGDLT